MQLIAKLQASVVYVEVYLNLNKRCLRNIHRSLCRGTFLECSQVSFNEDAYLIIA